MIIWENEIWEQKLSIFFPGHEVITGNIRVVTVNAYMGDYEIVGEDMAAILGYENVEDALVKYVKPGNKRVGVVIYDLLPYRKKQMLTVINSTGVVNLISSSKFYTGGAVKLKCHKWK